ncbi:MFS transporter [Streptomyces radiopugnans]|uniref:Na+/melibiose symporter n=1 Tax=Streptomyces radiopugnans TaxID=403935 RepID=A0A1H9K415_9ACTN|nr:MFS transporter [Streptomyces radiopugnans]SEQ93677.1 Na+/melibiose symporter [Streptomyces radiopugnans]
MTTATGAALRRIQTGNALSAFGNGFTVPFMFVYVAQVRNLGAAAAGTVLALFAVAALVVLPFTGRVIDRRGPLPVAVAGTVLASAGSLGIALSEGTVAMYVSAAVFGAGLSVIQPALATMIVWSSTTATRSRAFATQFFLNNLGLGVGGLLGGLVVDTDRPSSFLLLFGIESAMYLVLGATVATVRLPDGPRVECPSHGGEDGTAARDGLRALLSDRAMVTLSALGFVMFFACYGQFESGLSAYAVEASRISPATLGVALAANTAVIVLAQFVVLRLVERRRRSRVMALVGLIWTVAWLVAGVSGLVADRHALAVAAIISTYALFGLGEAMLSPTVAPLVADLAPARMVGRYNSAFALVKQLALAIGPAVGGPMGATLHGPYIVMLVLCSLGVTVLALLLGRRLTAEQDNPLRASLVVAASMPVRPVEEVRPVPATRSAEPARTVRAG